MANITNKKAISLVMGMMTEGQKKPAKRGGKTRDAAVHTPDERVAGFSLSYLDAFGYLKDEINQWNDITVGDIANAIGQFQDMFGLKKTKTLDIKTVRAMEAPRCGCPDIIRDRHVQAKGLRDFVKTNLPRWQKTGITFTISDYLPGIAKADMDVLVQAAFNKWTQYSDVSVAPAVGSMTPDIVISYGQGAQSNFDGPGGTLAWAYLPTGQDQQLLMRFDVDETWVTSPQQRGIIIHNVAAHEFGHLLGLDHSKISSALMAPYYNAAIDTPQPNDDIPRFQARYGVRTAPLPPPPTTPPAVPPVVPPAAGDQLTVTGTVTGIVLNGRKLV